MTTKLPLKLGNTESRQTIAKPLSQKNIERAVRGARNGGFNVGRIEISSTGNIILWSADNTPLQADVLERELQDWRRTHGAH